MEILFSVLDYLPLLLTVAALIVHFVVAHRLKCEKDILTCIRQDLLNGSVSDTELSALSRRLAAMEAIFEQLKLLEVKKNG